MSKIRQRRTADQIQMILSEVCRRQLQDPRLQDLTITRVTIDRELQYADIYVNALGDESRREDVMAGLEKASNFLRKELSGRMRTRTVPQLHFHWDAALAYAENIHQILDDLDIPTADDTTDLPEGDGD